MHLSVGFYPSIIYLWATGDMSVIHSVCFLDQLDLKNILILAMAPISKRDLKFALLKMTRYSILDHRACSPK